MSEAKNVQSTGPFDSLRDYVAALEARGRLLRIKELDQDKYAASAFAYRLIEKVGHDKAPAFMVERVKIGGEWLDGPVLCNPYAGWDIEAMIYGLDDIVEDQEVMFPRVMDKLLSCMDSTGAWIKKAPRTVEASTAPCKEVIISGDDVDVLKYPWFQNLPADAGRYINMTAVVIEHPEHGRNVGTYRCQVKGKNKISINPSPGHDGRRMLLEMKAKGEKRAKVAIALGVDPIIWSVSTTRMALFGEDELEIAGGVKGKPIDVVKCETSDIMVPAQSEMIIEGEIPLDDFEDEGPYGEMYGYLGSGTKNNFYVNIKAITHRHQPWLQNSFTGTTYDMLRAPIMASYHNRYKKVIPNFVGVYTFREAAGFVVVSIDKKRPGEGMIAGQNVAAGPATKVVVIVDKDINIQNPYDIFHAMTARWQPSASNIIPQTWITLPDPSLPHKNLGGKIVIDATRQFPEEGGPASWPAYNRTLLEEGCPEAFDIVDAQWDDIWQSLGR